MESVEKLGIIAITIFIICISYLAALENVVIQRSNIEQNHYTAFMSEFNSTTNYQLCNNNITLAKKIFGNQINFVECVSTFRFSEQIWAYNQTMAELANQINATNHIFHR